MKQERILRLLFEAANPKCETKRLQQIKAALGSQTDPSTETICENLFSSAVNRDARHFLPELFPLFAMLCGRRSRKKTMASINWDLAKKRP